jgi:hypothetical protein
MRPMFIYFFLVNQMYHLRATAKINPLEVPEIHLTSWPLPTNVSPYAPVGDRTQDQMVKGPKYLPLVSYYIGMSILILIHESILFQFIWGIFCNLYEPIFYSYIYTEDTFLVTIWDTIYSFFFVIYIVFS